MRFASVDEAARQLAEVLAGEPLRPGAVVVGLADEAGCSVEGPGLAEQVAALRGAELRLVRVEGLPVPWFPRFCFGALSADNHHYIDPVVAADHGLGAREIAQLCRDRLPDLRGPGWRKPGPLGDRDALVVTPALSTGYRALVAAASVRAAGAGTVVIAAACAADDALGRITPPLRGVALWVSRAAHFDPSACLPGPAPTPGTPPPAAPSDPGEGPALRR